MKTSFKNIIVLTDLSKKALNAVETAALMARRQQATLHLLQVYDIQAGYPAAGLLGAIPVNYQADMENNDSILSAMATGLSKKHEISCRYYQEAGLVIDLICKKVKQLNGDLVIIGTSSNLHRSTFLYESLAYRVVRHAPCAVLVVPAGKQITRFKNILFPLRLSENIRAKYISSLPIMLKNKSDVSVLGLLSQKRPGPATSMRKLVGHVRDWMKKDDLHFSSGVQIDDNLATSVVTAGQAKHADLIVINSSGETTFWEFFTGTFTQRLIRNPHAAVLCIGDRR